MSVSAVTDSTNLRVSPFHVDDGGDDVPGRSIERGRVSDILRRFRAEGLRTAP